MDWREGVWESKDQFFERVSSNFRYKGMSFLVEEGDDIVKYKLVGGITSAHAKKTDQHSPPVIKVVAGEIVVQYPDDTPDETLLNVHELIDQRVDLRVEHKIDTKVAELSIPTDAHINDLIDSKVPDTPTIHSLVDARVDDRIEDRISVKLSEVNVPDDNHIEGLIQSHIPDIDNLTNFVNQKVSELEGVQSAHNNELSELNTFKDNIQATVDSRIESQIASRVNTVEADVSSLKDTVQETVNLKGAVLTAMNAYKSEFRAALDID